MRRFLTRHYPLMAGAITASASFLSLIKYNEPPLVDPRQFLSMIVDISSIAVGFLGATMSIMLSIGNTDTIKQHKEAGTYDEIIRCLSFACLSCFLLAFFSLILVLFEMTNLKTGYTRRFTIVLWSGLSSTAGLSCYRVIDLMSRILRRSARE